MLARLSAILLVVALPVFAAPSPGTVSSSGQGCSTGSLHCCNDLQPVANPANQTLAGTLGAAIGSLAVQLGRTCSSSQDIGLSFELFVS
ncbi:hypothetical protein H0H93_004872 [Arthromyces matolae]|nr:hypothetical protein H0H93_004872 [Arthromyces matolae]